LFIAGLESAKANDATNLKFNEILVINDSNCVDDYGVHSAWIEIFNPTNHFVNIGGHYLTDDLNNPTKYWIPNGDKSTVIEPKNYRVFWADGKPERGIFPLNFNLKNARILALFDAQGLKIIDKVDIPQPQKPDVTYGRSNKGSNEWGVLDKSTPGTNNDLSKEVSAVTQNDELNTSGITGIVKIIFIVFFAIVFLFVIYKILNHFFIKKSSEATLVKEGKEISKPSLVEDEIPGEVNAAIAMAIYLYQNDLHDYENAVLTMQKVSRTYSPWSSKIYTLRKLPR
jgi:hypothetical protein